MPAAQTLLLQVMQHKQLLESNDDTILLQKIQLRAPYVTPLNVLQVYCLKALRAIESGQGIDPRYKARLSRSFFSFSIVLLHVLSDA